MLLLSIAGWEKTAGAKNNEKINSREIIPAENLIFDNIFIFI